MKQRIRVRTRQSGVAIIYAIFGAFVAASMVSVMLATGTWTNSLSEHKRDRTQAQYIAEGALDVARKELQDAVANWESAPTSGTAMVNGVSVAYTITQLAADTIRTSGSTGLQSINDIYEINSVALVDGVRYTAHRMVRTVATPIFQFAVFYNSDLEILPGPDMRLSGRVHSNGDMFLGCGGTMTIDTNYLRAQGDIYRRRKLDDKSKGTVDVRRWVQDPWNHSEPSVFETMYSRDEFAALGVTSPSGYDSDFAGWDADGDGYYDEDFGEWLPFLQGVLDRWSEPDGYATGSGNTVLTGSHGVQEARTPRAGSLKMFEEKSGGDYASDGNGGYVQVADGTGTHARGYFHENAGLSILVAEDGLSWEAYDGNGVLIQTPSPELSAAIAAGTIYDARQETADSSETPIIRVDMTLLSQAPEYPSNGLLYTSHFGLGEGTNAKGALLHNGSTLTDDLTVVSEGSLYVQGDYNSNNRKAAAVIADAVSLLSNDWDDTKDASSLPGASETTYNMAIITGNYDSTTGRYNGGLENLPRFHENWTGVNCNMAGSLVNLWESEYATGDWLIGRGRYKAPIRNWEYDSLFNSIANLPPFTPLSVTATDVVSW